MATIAEADYGSPGKGKFLVGGFLILAAVVYLIVSSTIVGAQTFYTIDEIFSRGENVVGVPVRITGAVLGDSILYDMDSLTLQFTVVHMPADNDILNEEGGLIAALKEAVIDPTRQRMSVEYIGVQPDLLRHEAQAIMTGTLGEDGVFYADELLLKCPTRYEEFEGVPAEQLDS